MEIGNDIRFFKDCYAVFIRSISAIVLADLHLGYEGVSAKNGIFLPKLNLKYILEQIERIRNEVGKENVKRVIVVGDIKNEFEEVEDSEVDELFSFVSYLRNEIFDKRLEIILIKGNHDNYVDAYAKSLNLKVFRQEYLIENYLMFHGEENPSKTLLSQSRFLITAHEHPAIAIYSEIGEKVKIKCFLYGRFEKEILVLPAISYYATGVEVNLIPREELLSPFLRSLNIDEMIPICVEGDVLIFPKIKKLRF